MFNKEKHNIEQLVMRFKDMKLKLVFQGVLVGIISGFIVIMYRLVLEKAEHFRVAFEQTESKPIWLIIFWFILLLVTSIFVGKLMIKEPMICGSGIPQTEGVLANKLKINWFRVLIYKFIGGVLCTGAGLSVGREGPSIQLGAVTGQGLNKLLKRSKMEEKYLITAGASAGLAAAFNAPLAGVMFALEEVHKHFSPLVLVAAMSASLTADFISKHFFGLKPVFNFGVIQPIPLDHYGYIILLGIIVGLFGVLYNLITMKTFKIYESLAFIKPHYRPIIPFMLAGVLLFILPQVLGGGHALVENLFVGHFTLKIIFVLLIAKFIFSMISFGAGVPGGIFFPLLVLGALAGSLYGNVLTELFNTSPDLIQNFIILAMAGFFTAIVRAPITGAILITEMTGSFSHLLSLAVISLIAYMVAEFFKSEPIYELLLHRILKNTNPDALETTSEKLIIEVPVFADSHIDGKTVADLVLPQECLLIGVKRGLTELIPRGNTPLYSGDYLIILINENIAGTVYDKLVIACQKQ